MAMDYVVPRRGATQARPINSLTCPTLANRPIESQSVFSRLSHRFSDTRSRRTATAVATGLLSSGLPDIFALR
jgi:hypothetical protein